MFTASLPRQAGRVARRQLSTLSPLLSTTSRASPAISSIRLPRTSSIRINVLQQLPSRCYSSEAAAQRPVDDSESNIITKFAEMPKIGVNQALVDSITKGMGYEDMTPVQSQTITPAMQGVDLVAQAKTGTGKTLAFLVPLLHRILESNPSLVNPFGGGRPSARDVQAIILSPTRELAEQIGVEAQKLVKGTGLKVQIAVGGTRKREALAKASREGCHILVATPGRLNDILSDPSSGIKAPRLQTFVLDEADRMLDVGFADELRNIQDFLPSKSEVDRQTLLFSATMSQKVISLAKDLVKRDNFRFVRTFNPDSEEQTHERVPQNLVPVEGYENFYPAIMEIADRALQQNASNPDSPPFKAIVFFGQTVAVQYAYRVFRNAETLTKRCPTLRQYEIHSKLDQPQRTRSADNFRRAQNAILFSSDVTARGMDFPGVTHVIQVGLPPDREQYIHRIGRTGRAGKEGQGWLLLAKGEIQEARSRLFNLPIKPNDTLQTSGLVIGKDTPPGSSAEYIDDIASAYKNVRGSFFEDLYNALLGQKFGRALSTRDALELVNNWARRGLGLDELPLISPNAAKNKGLSIRDDVNIGHRPRDDFGSDSGFGGGYGGRDSGGRGFGGRGFGGRDSGGRGFGGRDSGGRGFGGRDSGGRRGNTRDTRSGRDDIFSNDFDSGSRSGRSRGRASF